MTLADCLITRAKQNPKIIVLSEGEDPRVIEAAIEADRQKLANLILIGKQSQDCPPSITWIDPAQSELTKGFADHYYHLRSHKGITHEDAKLAVQDHYVFAALLVACGMADGTVGGAVASTAKIVRTALQIISTRQDAKIVSSFFLMGLEQAHHAKQGVFVFADCGLMIEPSAEELAMIACQSAASYRQLMDSIPKVAMLSFSTKGSAQHPAATKMIEATNQARNLNPDLMVDGELQFDAAFIPQIAATKAKDSPIAGEANIFIFPDLNSGNIAYKIAERIGGVTSIGPILQGLSKPANDLSRGCSVSDIIAMIAVTSIQAHDLANDLTNKD